MNKKILLASLLTHLEKELSVLTTAANNARAASIDEQSVAETQYDTLAIEAGYLAEGQAKRAQEIELEIHRIKQLTPSCYDEKTPINIGALVQLSIGMSTGTSSAVDTNEWYFIAPAGAGFKTTIEQLSITTITPQSPLGKSMLNKQVGDELRLQLANKLLLAEIIAVQ